MPPNTPEDFELVRTQRGFALAEFKDRYDTKCSIQESSIATEYCLWLGVDDYRMHLTQDMVQKLLPLLDHFVKTGGLPQQQLQQQAEDPNPSILRPSVWNKLNEE